MKKFAFIGAGSFVFTRNLVRDLLTFPAFEDCQIALMDINPLRLEKITACVNKINAAFGNKATVTSTMNRVEALEGADGVFRLRTENPVRGADARDGGVVPADAI